MASHAIAGEARPDVAQSLAAVSSDRPRLFLTPEREERIRQHLDADASLAGFFDVIREQADGMLDVEPVEREVEGRRLLEVSRKALKRVTYLAFTYRLTGEPQYLERAQEEMLAAAAFEDWNPSHFLDVAEMTTALAIGYDWLYDDLDSDARETIRDAIVEKGIGISVGDADYLHWVESQSNWGQVCHGSMVLGALAVAEDEPDLAQEIITRALANIDRPMAAYEPRGAYPEGPAYWAYGTTYNVLLLDALKSTLGTQFGLTEQHTGFMQTGDYMLHVIGATGDYFNYSDNRPNAGLQESMFWFALQHEDPNLLWHERRHLERFVAASSHDPGNSHNRLVPFLLIWSQPLDDLEPPAEKHWNSGGVNPIGTHRSAWTDDAVYLGIKGGRASVAHGHMDIGSFVLDADGVRWSVDLGAQSYHGLEEADIDLWDMSQDGGRWDVFRLNNRSHSTLVVNDELQRVHGEAPITRFSDDEAMAYSIVDMAEVYEGQLAKAKRGGALRDGQQVVIQDELQATDEPAHVRWGMVTRAEVEIVDNGRAILTQDGQTLGFEVLSPGDAEVQLYAMEPPAEHDEANPGVRMIGFEVTLEPNEQQRLVVALTPGETSASQLDVEPLDEW